ncbi:ribonuclease HII [Mycoplasma sp. Pen4]|nr:ribonuclease HII [Mycoplasma sp. Pen4]
MYEKLYSNEYKVIAGCDEVGRGCIAGELVTACVILPTGYVDDNIKDSKVTSHKKREKLYEQIMRDAIEIAIDVRSLDELNSSNPKAQSRIGMANCIKKLKHQPDLVLTDFEPIETNIKQLNLVKGETKSISIAAASIIAKVVRDNMLDEYAKIYPEYGFEKHKGYFTKLHKTALEIYGVTPIHRLKYKPVVEQLHKDKMSKG